MRSVFKNTALATVLATTLTACGGGGGGGAGDAVGTISNWVNNDLTELNSSYVTPWTDLIQLANAKISEEGEAKAILTGPTEQDITKANELIGMISTAETLWTATLADLDGLNDSKKYEMLNDTDFQNAYKAMEYLKNTVKPLLEKVAGGNKLNYTEYQSMDSVKEAEKIQNAVDIDAFVETKIVKSSVPRQSKTETYNQNETSGEMSIVPINDWATVFEGGGKETRDVWQVTPQNNVVKNRVCTWNEVTKITATGSQTFKQNEVCTTETITTPTDDLKVKVTEEQAGDNPVVGRGDVVKNLGTPVTETANEKTENVLDKTVDNPDEIQELSWNTETQEFIKTRFIETVNPNVKIKVDDKYIRTTVTKPIKIIKSVTQHWTDKVFIDQRTATPWTKTQQVTFKDGTTDTETLETGTDYTEWTTKQKSESPRSVKVDQDPVDSFYPADVDEKFVEEVSRKEVNYAYTDNDVNLGTKTEVSSNIASDHETQEYNNTNSLGAINASSAYARGWTGKGSVLGVIDTWQDTDHKDLDGKYKWYYDYVNDVPGYSVTETMNHGTHVAGTIAGKKNETGTHGVAYDAELVGANVDKRNNGRIDFTLAQNAIHDMAKLKSPVSEGGQGVNLVAINMSFNSQIGFIHTKRDENNNFIRDDNGVIKKFSSVNTLNDGTYQLTEIDNKVYHNEGAHLWKNATDNDIILVNSAGNNGWDYPTMPSNFATEENADGSLVLGGKMLIVGNWDIFTKANAGNKAGHICLKHQNNVCQDNYRTSDFYIMAPGVQVRNTTINDTYGNMTGTSMAAPHVTGALGVLHQMWPHMKGENLVQLVLNTADKDLPNYQPHIHGQGLLDLDEATKPQGAVGIVTTGRVDNPTVNLNNTYISAGSGWIQNLSDLNIMVIDDYDRDYYMNIGSSFVVQDKRKVSDIEQLNNGYMWMPINQNYGSFAQGEQWDLGYMNFGLFTGESGNGDYSTNIGKKFFISDRFAVKGNVGQMKENTTWLGNSSDGVLAVGENNITDFAQIGASYQIGNNVLSLDYNRGSTDINTTDNSLITGFSDVKTESWRLAYEMHKDENNTLGWSFSLPSHITSGSMDMEVAESVNLDGTINYTNINSDLTQKHKEKNIGFFFNHTPTHDTDASFNFTAEYRQDIAGVNGNDGIELGMNYVKKFWGACKFLWMKNPKCYTKDAKGKEVLTAEMQKLMFGHNNDNSATKHGLVYDMKTDMFVPINPEDPKWKQ
jgi:hypothetical protein